MGAGDSDSEESSLMALFEQTEWLILRVERLVQDHSAALDLVEETFLAAIKNPPRYLTRPRAWLSVTAHIIHHRQARRVPEYSEELVLAPSGRWQIYQDEADMWRWRRQRADGKVTDPSQRAFESRAECEEDARFEGWNGWDG